MLLKTLFKRQNFRRFYISHFRTQWLKEMKNILFVNLISKYTVDENKTKNLAKAFLFLLSSFISPFQFIQLINKHRIKNEDKIRNGNWRWELKKIKNKIKTKDAKNSRMVSSLLSIGYLMPIVGRAYFRKPSEKDEHLHEAPWMCVLPLCITAFGCLVLFLFPDFLYDLMMLMFEEVSRWVNPITKQMIVLGG